MKTGILGAGQLAQLLAHAAYQLGFETLCYADSIEQPASRFSEIFVGELNDHHRLKEFAHSVDVITLENENIETATLNYLKQFCPVYPAEKAVQTAQDRLLEKQLFKESGIATPHYHAIDSELELKQILNQQSLPALLKTRRFGYDGKGQYLITHVEEADQAWYSINQQPAVLESFLDFDHEVSLIAARNRQGAITCYPLIRNDHHEGILRVSSLTEENHPLQEQAEAYVVKLLQTLDYVGVLTVEFFAKGQQLFANEMAPRVHNSGHLTIEATNFSQFEMHLRAITGLPLPDIQIKQSTSMINLIGELPHRDDLLKQFPELHFYDYGKTPRPNRKLGHLVISEENEDRLSYLLNQI